MKDLSHDAIWRKSFPGKVNHAYKGPEGDPCLFCSKVIKEAHMAGSERTMGRIVGEEFKEVMVRRMCMRETEESIHLIQGL